MSQAQLNWDLLDSAIFKFQPGFYERGRDRCSSTSHRIFGHALTR